MVKTVGIVMTAMLVAAACGGSSDGSAPALEPATTLRSDAGSGSDTATSSTTTSQASEAEGESAETTTTAAATDAPADAPAGQPAEGGLVATALWELPQIVTDDNVQIVATDFGAAAELLGIETAPADERIRAIAVALPVSEGGLGFQFASPEIFRDTYREPAVLEDEAGFSFDDVERVSEVWLPPDRFSVIVGPDAWGGLAEPYEGDLLTIGQGDDLMFDPDGRTSLDSLGRPLRLADRDGRLAASFSTPLIEAWADQSGATYAGDDRISPVAEALDGHDVVSAFLYIGDFFATPDLFSEDAIADFENQPFIDQPFIAVGIGNTIRDGQAIEVVAYRFLTDDSAEAAMASIENAWTNADSIQTAAPIAELAEFESIERTGPVVTVVVRVPDGQIGRALNMVFTRDVTLAHR